MNPEAATAGRFAHATSTFLVVLALPSLDAMLAMLARLKYWPRLHTLIANNPVVSSVPLCVAWRNGWCPKRMRKRIACHCMLLL